MPIKSIELENWKSYGFAKILFDSGVTAILGENGSGKSSILEAVGFALFDHRNGKLEALLREGAKSGRVAISLTSSLDGAEYLVEREFTAKATTSYRVHQPERANQIVAQGAADVQRWLRTHMGVPPDAQLGTVFENTIGVPQGTFTAPFLLAPAQRKAVFDPLLRVEEYRKASDNLRPTVRQLKDEKATLDTEIARMEGVLTGLPGLREEHKTLGYDLARLGTVRALRTQQLEKAEAKLRVLGQAAKRVEEADRQTDTAKVRLDAHEALCETALHGTEEAEKATQVVAENLVGYEAYIEAEVKVQELETSQQEQARLLAKRAQLEVQIARLEGARQEEERSKQQIAQGKMRVQETEAGVEKAGQLEKQIQALDTEADQIRELLTQANATKAGVRAEWQGLQRQSDFLADAVLAACPTCGSELTTEHREEIRSRNEIEIEGLRSEEARHNRHTADLQYTIAQLGPRRVGARDRLRNLPAQGDLARTRQDLAKREGELEAIKGRLEMLAQAPSALKQVDVALEPFAGLERELSLWRARHGLHKRGHTLYLGNVTLAQQQPERQARLEEVRAKRNELVCEWQRLAEEHWRAKGDYDGEEHANVQAETTRLQLELAGVQAQLKEKAYRLTVVKESIESLEGLEKELAVKSALATETSDLLATMETVRDILREAGPYVTRRLVRQISQGASTTFGDLMGDSGRRLQWSEDYEVSLDVRGHSRTFAQLSGGEQMVAALAVRLALLRETSAIDVAFFDEPTAHLDPERRQSLADRLSQVKGFSQLFVISHDSTFESAAENTIRIVKDERGSQQEEERDASTE